MGALSAAWELSRHPNISIDVYEMDGILGGKCSSTRNPDPKYGRRVHEHGLHVLMGFYDHVLYVLRETYREVAQGRDGNKIRPWKDALSAVDRATMADPVDGKWGFWSLRVPSNRKSVGDKPSIASRSVLFDRGVALFESLRRDLYRYSGQVSVLANVAAVGIRLLSLIYRWTDLPAFRNVAVLRVLRDALLVPIERWLDRSLKNAWHIVSNDLDHRKQTQTQGAARAERLSTIRHGWIAAWFAGTNLLGMKRDKLLSANADFSKIDDEDYRDWLGRHSVVRVEPPLGTHSPIVEAFYDLAFSHWTTLGAGTTLNIALRMALDYKGSLGYKMNGGMGDIVFAPLYFFLRNRNVRIHFRHEVTSIHARLAGDAIDEVHLTSRLPDSGSCDSLQPVVTPKGRLWCWGPPCPPGPDKPFVLKAGRDFDVAVLAIPIEALRPICQDLRRNTKFSDMLDNLPTVPTQAVQIWLDATLAELGWNDRSRLLISFEHPYNSWADMEHTLAVEPWPTMPKTLAYFAEPIVDPQFEGLKPEEYVLQQVTGFFAKPVNEMWPGFRWDMLHDPDNRRGPARLGAQFWRANVEPTSRYTLAKKGTSRFRLAPHESGFSNLALAGDWVRSNTNAGAVEAAAEAGLAAAQAILEGKVHG